MIKTDKDVNYNNYILYILHINSLYAPDMPTSREIRKKYLKILKTLQTGNSAEIFLLGNFNLRIRKVPFQGAI